MATNGLFDLTGKAALVTGGAMGLGRACAEALATSGANVAVVDRNPAVGRQTVAQLQAHGVDAFFVECDVSEQEAVNAMTAEVASRFGRIDIAVNNAGIGLKPGGAENLLRSAWDKVLAIDLNGVFFCCQAQAQQILRQRPVEGKIINTASIYATLTGGNVAYNAAKAAVVQVTRTLAAEWGKYNINVNCISPSWVMTPAMIGIEPELRDKMRTLTPLGHVQRPEDLKGAFIFLASKASDYVTGHNLIVDGGMSLNSWLRPNVRDLPPRASPEDEVREALEDLAAVERGRCDTA